MYAPVLRSYAEDKSTPSSIRHASIHALSRMGDTKSIPLLQSICDDYQADSDSTVVRAAVVALGDLAHAQAISAASPQIQRVLTATKDPDVYGSAIYAMSRLDSPEFVSGLPSIMDAQSRFEGNSLARNSLIAIFWARPADILTGLKSDDPAVLRASIQAATLVPLPPALSRLNDLLQDQSRSDHDIIRLAIEKSVDEATYQRIMNQSEKAKESHYEK